MIASTSTNHHPTEDVTVQLGSFLKEHGEIEAILPVAIGVLVTSQFKLRGANALLVNLLVASLARQIFTQLKQEPFAIEDHPPSAAVDEREAATNLQGYAIAHAIPGRVRLQMPQLAIDANFAHRLQQALNGDEHVTHVRINRAAASIAINYNNQGLTDWELGLRLMTIINTVQQEQLAG